eukprot:6383958-Alexandrium_andersonii.AAC.1
MRPRTRLVGNACACARVRACACARVRVCVSAATTASCEDCVSPAARGSRASTERRRTLCRQDLSD